MNPPDDDAGAAADSDGRSHDPTVVGLGASAGGLKALRAFFERIPADSGLAFVVVVHLSPDHESHLADLLQPHTRMPVLQVRETVRLQANHVYLIPPGANLEAVDTHLRLSQLQESRRDRAPVDHFFRTLAQTHDGHSIGVILSGTGSDGALGIKAIKERGGLAVVQAPADAEYDGMPQSAIATGVVDVVLPLSEVPEVVLRYARTRPRIPPADEEAESAAQLRRVLQKIFAQVRARTGRDFSRYKRSTLLRRITRRMQLHSVEELSDYNDLLRQHPEEVVALADDFLITVTNFFRDPPVYEKLAQEVLPRIFDRKSNEVDGDVRVWSVGCATGEEAYSLAMLLLEEAGRRDTPPRMQVFASDLHEHSLERARQAFFPGDIETDVSPERLRRFFVQEDGGYRVREDVREMVVFAPHNLLSDPPFSRIDLISCRNLLIYLQRDAQDEADELFHYALRPGGFLAIGSSEAIARSELFVVEDKRLCIYRRRDVPTPEPRLPVFPTRRTFRYVDGAHAQHAEQPTSYGDIHQRALERYGPPSALIGPDDKIVNLSGNAGRFLVHPSGEVTTSAFRLMREELRLDLRGALSEVRHSGRPTRTRPIWVQFNGEAHPVVVHVRPCLEPDEAGFVLVVFEEWEDARGGALASEETTHDSVAAGVREREREAERELLRQRLHAVIEEYETGQEEMKASNEELQSANEELRSTMEELETSKEELHSMNEELQTVNQENRHKVEELSQLSGDLQNLLSATDIATLFLDRQLRIMRFTPKVGELFNVRATDRGRPLSDLTHRLGYDELQEDAAQVLSRFAPVEREVRDEAGRWYLVRVLPYRSAMDRIDGVVITFVDTSALKQVEQALRRAQEEASKELAVMVELHELVGRLLVCHDLPTALSEVLDATVSITRADMGNVQLLGAGDELRMAAHRGFSKQSLEHFTRIQRGDASAASRALQAGRRVVIADVDKDPAYAPHREAAAAARYRGEQATPLRSRSGDVLGVLCTYYAEPYHPSQRDLRVLDLYTRQATDFIERVRGVDELNEKTRQLEEEDRRKLFFLATLGHELRNPLSALDLGMQAIDAGTRSAEELHPKTAAQVRRLARLVDDLLEVSRITRGELRLRMEPIDLAGVARAAAEALVRDLRLKQQELVLSLEPTPTVRGDEVRLEQVVVNLLDNASKYSGKGARIELDLRQQGDQALLTVRDEGQGLNAGELGRIFAPFAQAEPGSGGLGIGLALVERVVKLHGGSIEAHSAGSGRGSVFTLRLPLDEVDQPSQLPARERVDGGAGAGAPSLPPSTRVLVVDDVADNAEFMALLMERFGAQTRCAYNAAQGLEQARDFQPHVALIDLGLPDMPGWQLAERLRDELGRSTVRIAITGFSEATAEEQAADAFDARLVKPVGIETLRELLVRHLAERERE